MKNIILLLTTVLLFTFCSAPNQQNEQSDNATNINEDSLLNLVQYQTFQYFWDGAEPNSGLARERFHEDNLYPSNDKHIVTSGGSGFGLMAIIVGVKRGFIERSEAIERFEKNLDFLETADRFHGAYPHWLNGETGEVKAFSAKDDGGDLVETAFLIQGLLTVRQFLDTNNDREEKLAQRISKIWEEVEWDWYTKGGEDVLYWHWSPNHGWNMNFPVGGYNECLIMYVLAASSPTHSIKADVYHNGWARGGAIANDTTAYGLPTILDHYEHANKAVGPLFWAHYSYLGLDPKNLNDKYGNYWDLNRNHALIQYHYAVENPNNFEGYGENLWGLTSSYSMRGYAGHNPSDDLGVISPTAALSSFPYTPKESMQFLKFLYEPKRDSLIGDYGPYDAFSFEHDWYVPRYLAIDQGPIPVMIENHRSGLIWELFMRNKEVEAGLSKLGFYYEE
ncbi:glucoamylase family protein [Marivirga sp.]|uniref:glucoamylase family protein n=1 Tax=Marivirga sp. TaxID=2018662 RepID=UPI0025FE07F5|nr:glucoamylase family protein [Marivirga sp.]